MAITSNSTANAPLARVIDAVLDMLRNAHAATSQKSNILQAIVEFERYQDRKQDYTATWNMLDFLTKTEKNPHIGAMLLALQDILSILGNARGDI